jgi:Short C-terminal domain
MPGLLRGMARTAAIAGTAQAARNRVNKRQSERWAEQEAAEGPQQPVAEARPAAAAPQNSIEQLKELAQLKEQGILTEEEFAAQKAKILGS